MDPKELIDILKAFSNSTYYMPHPPTRASLGRLIDISVTILTTAGPVRLWTFEANWRQFGSQIWKPNNYDLNGLNKLIDVPEAFSIGQLLQKATFDIF